MLFVKCIEAPESIIHSFNLSSQSHLEWEQEKLLLLLCRQRAIYLSSCIFLSVTLWLVGDWTCLIVSRLAMPEASPLTSYSNVARWLSPSFSNPSIPSVL